MMVSKTAKAPTWIGTARIKAGMTTAPVRLSHGWKLIAAQAVGG
jgi:hypothetical protein